MTVSMAQQIRCTERCFTGADVSVIIPILDVSERLARCVDTLSSQTSRPYEVVVVSSGLSEAGDIDRRWPGIRLVACPLPTSFTRAVNHGIVSTAAEWILLLNDDVVLAESFLEALLAGLPADDRIGMVCGKLLSADGRVIDSTGQFVSRTRTAVERGHGEVDRGQFDAPGYVFSAPGAAALYRRRMLEELAVEDRYFDEDLGMYLEDLDLGWRAQRAGWRAYYVPDAVGFHARGATAKTRQPRWRWLRRYYLPWLSPELQARYIVNRYQLITKYDSPSSLLKDSPWLIGYELRLWLYLLCCEWRTVAQVWQVWRGVSWPCPR